MAKSKVSYVGWKLIVAALILGCFLLFVVNSMLTFSLLGPAGPADHGIIGLLRFTAFIAGWAIVFIASAVSAGWIILWSFTTVLGFLSAQPSELEKNAYEKKKQREKRAQEVQDIIADQIEDRHLKRRNEIRQKRLS